MSQYIDSHFEFLEVINEFRSELRKELAVAVSDGVNLAFSDKKEMQNYLKSETKTDGNLKH